MPASELEPEKLFNLFQWLAGAGVLVASALMAVFGVRNRRKRNADDDDLVTKLDLSEAIRNMEAASKRDREGIYTRLDSMAANMRLDLHEVSDQMAEYARAIDGRVRNIETISIPNLQQDVARLEGRRPGR